MQGNLLLAIFVLLAATVLLVLLAGRSERRQPEPGLVAELG